MMARRLGDVLDEIEEYLRLREDTRDGPDGPRPNEEMSLLADLQESRRAVLDMLCK